MLAYRHAFHAGNHGDVLKHLVYLLVLRHVLHKDKGVRIIDTHAGAGGYSLESRYAKRHEEFEQGVGRLWSLAERPPIVEAYLEIIRSFNPDGVLRQMPGSPAIARHVMRPQDQLRLFELHPTDYKVLSSFVAGAPGVLAEHRDGFASLKSVLPPPTRRAVLLIDPSFEGDADYGRVVAAVREALERFAESVILVWYPQVQKVLARELPRRLVAAAPKGWVHARLTVQPVDSRGFGLAGSGMVVINPPHTLYAELQALLPWLVGVLGQYDGASHRLEHKSV
ncbi:MAG: 23S rRNA (adenine(2030)-N(6))-methyltransferase RlmJ [Ideonella sp.]|jgi:23S rRNA (adenine2030-N6)-methyltransferase|nr:23S rRNA (adenine(2030)-N(6))-methyltransferase RlmJ [Ideonella sp.]